MATFAARRVSCIERTSWTCTRNSGRTSRVHRRVEDPVSRPSLDARTPHAPRGQATRGSSSFQTPNEQHPLRDLPHGWHALAEAEASIPPVEAGFVVENETDREIPSRPQFADGSVQNGPQRRGPTVLHRGTPTPPSKGPWRGGAPRSDRGPVGSWALWIAQRFPPRWINVSRLLDSSGRSSP